jgi:allantoinase
VRWTWFVMRGRWMSERPARIAGLASRKGSIAPGRDADLLVWEPEKTFTVDARTLQHRHKLTPYDGMRLRGVVLETWLRGERIYDRGDFPAPPRGTLIHSADA